VSNLANRFAVAVEESELPCIGLKDLSQHLLSLLRISWQLSMYRRNRGKQKRGDNHNSKGFFHDG